MLELTIDAQVFGTSGASRIYRKQDIQTFSEAKAALRLWRADVFAEEGATLVGQTVVNGHTFPGGSLLATYEAIWLSSTGIVYKITIHTDY